MCPAHSRRMTVFLAGPALLMCATLGAHPNRFFVQLDHVMSAEDQRATGVSRLTAAERIRLEEWLTTWSATLRTESAKTDPGSRPAAPTGRYPATGGGHWLKENVDRGRVLILEDRSTWQINSLDRLTCSLWLRMTSITVMDAPEQVTVGEYRYWIISSDGGEKVLARYVGR
jgi:hypothetical protein